MGLGFLLTQFESNLLHQKPCVANKSSSDELWIKDEKPQLWQGRNSTQQISSNQLILKSAMTTEEQNFLFFFLLYKSQLYWNLVSNMNPLRVGLPQIQTCYPHKLFPVCSNSKHKKKPPAYLLLWQTNPDIHDN